MQEVRPQMRDVFEEAHLVAERDVIEQDEVLVKLAHVADVRHYGDAEMAAAADLTA